MRKKEKIVVYVIVGMSVGINFDREGYFYGPVRDLKNSVISYSNQSQIIIILEILYTL